MIYFMCVFCLFAFFLISVKFNIAGSTKTLSLLSLLRHQKRLRTESSSNESRSVYFVCRTCRLMVSVFFLLQLKIRLKKHRTYHTYDFFQRQDCFGTMFCIIFILSPSYAHIKCYNI